MQYSILLTPRAQRQFRRLSAREKARIGDRIDALASDPRPPGCEKLQGHDRFYRVRAGNYRIIYEIDENVVRIVVVLIGHRREIYRDLQNL